MSLMAVKKKKKKKKKQELGAQVHNDFGFSGGDWSLSHLPQGKVEYTLDSSPI